MLSSGFHEIEDIVDGESLCFLSLSRRPRSCRLLVFDSLFCFFVSFADFFPGQSQAAIQAIEADRASRRAEGVEIAADGPAPTPWAPVSPAPPPTTSVFTPEEMTSILRDLVKAVQGISLSLASPYTTPPAAPLPTATR